MPKEIEKEIEKLAEKMTKSVNNGKQDLFDTIMNLGPEGLRKALPALSPAQREIVAEALGEMKKATHPPTKTEDADHLTPEQTQTKHAKMRAESETGSDDQDEKLMEDKNKDIKHQGGPTDKPAGWEGQIIKAQEPPYKGPHGGTIIGHTHDGKPIYEHAGHESHKDFAPVDHQEAAEMHDRLAGKHQEEKMRNPYTSVEGLQSMGGKKRKFKEAKAQYEKDAGDHELHRESSAFHRRMADAKSGMGTAPGDMKPEDHKAQAEKHLDRVNKLHELRKCGYGPLMKDMGQGGAGDYGLAMSMNKAGTGEGSKGGKVIGHTKDGKPIYATSEHHAPSTHDPKAQFDKEVRSKVVHIQKPWASDDPHEIVHLESGHASHGQRKGKFKVGDEVVGKPHIMGTHILEHAEKVKKAYENSTTLIRSEDLEKKQGVPEGVDPEKHEDCVHDVKAQGHGKVSAIKICNASMAKKSFAEVEEHAREEGAKDPKAVAAAVGFKKLGKEEMERRAQAGKKAAKKSLEENLTPEQKLEKAKMKKAKKIVKSVKKIVKMCKALGMTKSETKAVIEKANGNLKLVKAELKEKMNPEQDQVEIKTQDESEITTPKPDQSKGDLEIKPDETADEALSKLPKVQKSLPPWQMKNSLAAGTLGRNTHWSVDAFIEKSEAERKEIIKKGGYFGEKEVEDLKKSEKADINTLLEKGMDYSADEIARLEGIRTHKPDAGAVKKSNYDVEIARSMGISEAEYKKIFGSNEDY